MARVRVVGHAASSPARRLVLYASPRGSPRVPHFLLELRPSRERLPETMTDEERALVARHFARLERLCREGKLLLAGRAQDAAIGVAVLDVEDLPEAQRIVEEDPALKAGVMVARLHEFRLALYAPRNKDP